MKIVKNYKQNLNRILRTYNSILVKCKNIPLLPDKNIIIVENIDDMINTQIETRKPLLYYREANAISFMIVDGTEFYIYILKENESIQSGVEHLIKEFQITRNTYAKEIMSKLESVLLIGKAQEAKYIDTQIEKTEESSFNSETASENTETTSNEKELPSDNNKIVSDENETNSNDKKNLSLIPVKQKRKFTFFKKYFAKINKFIGKEKKIYETKKK